MNSDVKKININGIMFMAIKNINFLSLKFIFILNFETVKKNIMKKGISIPICFPKNING